MRNQSQRSVLLWAGFFLLLLAPFVPTLLAQQASEEISQARQAAAGGDWQAAAQHMANAAASQPGQSELWEEAGHFALQAGDAQMAQVFLERSGRERLSAQGLIDLGDVYQQEGDAAQAIGLWVAALEKGGAGEAIYARLFEAYRQSANLAASSTALRRLADEHPEEAQVQYQAGLFLAAAQPGEALEYLSRAGELDGRLARRAEKLTQAIWQAQNQAPTAGEGGEAAEISPAYLFVAAGRALAALDEWRLAEYAFEQAASLQPDYAEAWAHLGEARTHNAADEAEGQRGLADIQHALQIDPASLSAHLFLAYYWTRQQEFGQAQQTLAEAQGLYPDSPLLQAEMGNVLALSGDVQAAYASYAKAIALAPDDPAYLHYLIRFSLMYNYDVELQALPVARRAVILAPSDSETLDLMAQVLIYLGDLANAERFVQRALQAEPDYAPAHFRQGLLYLMREQLDLARQEFELVVELEPGSAVGEQAERMLGRGD